MAEKYLTFLIASTSKVETPSKNGTLTISGPFDVGFGFILENTAIQKSHFAAEGIRLYNPKPEDKNTVFTVSIRENVATQRYYLKFQDPKNLKLDINLEGSIEFSNLSFVDSLKTV